MESWINELLDQCCSNTPSIQQSSDPETFNLESMIMEATKTAVKNYILNEFLPGENPAALTEATPLITGGILDSLATLKLVSFLEEKYKIQIEAHEADVEHLDTIDSIAALVHAKMA